MLMPVESVDSYLLNTVNTLLGDETSTDTNPGNDDSRQTKILKILDDPKEVKKGRQKELNSLRETAVKCHDNSEAILSSWHLSDTDALGRSRERRVREVQIGSEGLQS